MGQGSGFIFLIRLIRPRRGRTKDDLFDHQVTVVVHSHSYLAHTATTMVLYRRVRYAVPVGLVALLLALVLMGTASTPTDGSSQVELEEVREDVVRELYDSSDRMVNPDRKMQSIAKANDGGFGGYYFDENNPSTVYVYMLDVTKAAEAEAAFRAAVQVGRDLPFLTIT